MGAENADIVAREFRRRCEEDSRSKDEIDNYDDGPGEEMANCEFSLAYGEWSAEKQPSRVECLTVKGS